MTFTSSGSFFSFCISTSLASFSGFQEKQYEAAVLLGTTPLKAYWHVEWPRWRVPVFSALAGVIGERRSRR